MSRSANAFADRFTKDTVRDFLTELLDDKPAYVITTDGRDEYAEIVEDNVDFAFGRYGVVPARMRVIDESY